MKNSHAYVPPVDSPYGLTRWKPVFVDDLVRIGRDQDGGYVISHRCVAASRLVIGFGICDDWSFEEAFTRANPNSQVLGIDGSVSPEIFRTRSREATVKALFALVRGRVAQARNEFRAARRWKRTAAAFRAFFDGKTKHFRQLFIADEANQWARSWADLVGNEPVIAGAGQDSYRIFVKMDIEGSEYRVLSDLLADANRINGFVIEFHDCDIHWDCFSQLMDELSENFAVVHIHGNNYAPLIRGSTTPRAMEISAVNRRLLPQNLAESRASYPLRGLDRPCDPTRPDYVIRF